MMVSLYCAVDVFALVIEPKHANTVVRSLPPLSFGTVVVVFYFYFLNIKFLTLVLWVIGLLV